MVVVVGSVVGLLPPERGGERSDDSMLCDCRPRMHTWSISSRSCSWPFDENSSHMLFVSGTSMNNRSSSVAMLCVNDVRMFNFRQSISLMFTAQTDNDRALLATKLAPHTQRGGAFPHPRAAAHASRIRTVFEVADHRTIGAGFIQCPRAACLSFSLHLISPWTS